THRKQPYLQTPAVEEAVTADEHRITPLSRHRSECRIDLACGTGLVDRNIQPNGKRRRFSLLGGCSSIDTVGWIDEHRDVRSGGHQLLQNFEPLSPTLHISKDPP